MSDPLTEIKQLYFRASPATIQRDFERAIDLLKTLPSEDARERATVYMQGLAEMKKEWGTSAKSEVRGAKSVRSAESDVRSKFGSAKFGSAKFEGAKSGVRSAKSDLRTAKPAGRGSRAARNDRERRG